MASNTRIRSDFQCSKPWREPSKAHELISILHRFDDVDLSPLRYGSSTSRTFALKDYSDDEIGELWTRVGGGIFKGSNKWNAVIQVFFMKGPKARAMSSLWIHLDEAFFIDEGRTKRFIELCKEIYLWGDMDHGYIAHQLEYDRKNKLGPQGGFGGANLKIALPGVYWINFFGPLYVSWFGEDKFRKLAVGSKERLKDGGWMIITRKNPAAYASKQALQQERTVVTQLGRDAFFERRKLNKKISTPNFWDE
jgi:hypothetical protein